MDLFPTQSQREFLRNYCEQDLKSQSASYFSGDKPLRTTLEHEDFSTFIIDDKNLIILFQPYVAGSKNEGPFHVKIPYRCLIGHWNMTHPLPPLLTSVISSKSFAVSKLNRNDDNDLYAFGPIQEPI